MNTENNKTLLSVKDLSVSFNTQNGLIKIIDNQFDMNNVDDDVSDHDVDLSEISVHKDPSVASIVAAYVVSVKLLTFVEIFTAALWVMVAWYVVSVNDVRLVTIVDPPAAASFTSKTNAPHWSDWFDV